MFKITPAAAAQVKEAADQGGTEGMALRFAANQKQDGSIDYLMGFDEPSDEDIRFSSEGIDIIIAPEYVALLDEAIMDFVELESGERRFIFLNPRDDTYIPPNLA